MEIKPSLHEVTHGANPHEAPRVTVAIVTYRSKVELRDCVESVLRSDIPLKIVIIDNDSQDGTFELARDLERSSRNVIAVQSGRNVGLAAGNNLALSHVVGEYILMLNPDTIVESNTISTMVGILDIRPDVGIVGPTNVYGDCERFSSYQRAWNLRHPFQPTINYSVSPATSFVTEHLNESGGNQPSP